MYDDCRCRVARGIRQRTSLALIALISMAPVGARANDAATTRSGAGTPRATELVFEVHAGACPRFPNEYVVEVLRQLGETGRVAFSSDLRNVPGSQIPLPSQGDPTMTASRIRAKFKEAKRRATGKNWNFEQAIALYKVGFRWAEENQAVVVKELDAPTWMTEAYVGYATALTRAKQLNDAKEAYKQQIISFPDLPVTSNRHGPDAAELYEAVRKEVDAAPHGTLLVTINRPDANIFINYVGRGRGGNFQANVVAGTYEVLVEVGDRSLRYVVPTDPATTKNAELRIDWDVDSRIVVGTVSACIEHVPNPRDILPGLQRKLPGRGFVLASLEVSEGVRWLRVERYQPLSKAPSPACVVKEGDGVDRKVMDCFDGKDVPGVFASVPVPWAPAAPREPSDRPSQLRPLLGLATAAGSIGAALYFSSIHGDCTREDASSPDGCAETRDTRLGMGLALGVGAVSLGYAVYAYSRYARAVRSNGATIGVSTARGGGILTVSGGF
jgi:hypothetical protein